jgi:hypothetical protein
VENGKEDEMDKSYKDFTCNGCSRLMTWDDHKKQFRRLLMRHGFTKEKVKEVMPKCEKCMTAYLDEHPETVRILKRL